MKPRYLLDEHVNSAVQRQLRRLDARIDVFLVGDGEAPPKGTLDPELLIWAEMNDFVVVSRDVTTLPDHVATHLAAGRHTKGVFWLRRKATLGDVIESLYLIWSTSDAEEYIDQSLFIPL